jgi:YesN/AraC family two-component response regulator
LQENLGESFSVLLRKHRIECAKALMLSGNLSLDEIAFLSGYQSYKGFHTAFRKETGTNPKSYRG